MANLKKHTRRLFSLFFCAALLATGCNFLSSVTGGGNNIEITSLTLAKPTLSMKVGTMDYIAVTVKPGSEQKNVRLNWSYDKSIIECDTTSAWGVTIKALKEGQTSLRCSYNGYDANCVITVAGYAEGHEEEVEPYIYSNTSILQTSPGVTERVYVSLYGGTAADIDGYTWTCDNPSVCGIQPTGQYCLVTAKDSGYARIKITHSKSAYPYYMGIYVFGDATNVPYITTSNNIVTMNQGDQSQTITVSLVNGKGTPQDNQFRWEIVNDGATCPIGVEYNGNKAVVTPLKGGSCTLRVSHPDAAYPLDILCRVLTVVKNVYIKSSDTVVTISGEDSATVSFSLENINIGEYDANAYEYALDDYNVAEIYSTIGGQVVLKGKANGSCKLIATHEKAAYAKEVLVIVNGQLTDATDASCYITTSQNYIRTKVGAEGTYVNISLRGGEEGDEAGFVWSVKSAAADGSSSKVINVETVNGSVVNARMAAQSFAYGRAYIEPVAEGTATITITHPKIVYPTEILVKVLDENAILEDPMYFIGVGLKKMLNGTSDEYTLMIQGKNKKPEDDSKVSWECDDSRVRLTPNGTTVNITAPSLGTGSTISNITATHPKIDTAKKVILMTADDEETLASMKALYSDKLYYNIGVGETAYCMATAVGFETVDGQGDISVPDFSSATWSIGNPSVAVVEKSSSDPLLGVVRGLRAGTTTATVRFQTYSCEFTITVYPEGAIQTEPEVYFTTTQNVVVFEKPGKSATVLVNGVNLQSCEFPNITWTCSDNAVANVVPNGNRATITALAEGEAVVSVTHPYSQNTLKIYVRIGSEYVVKDAEPVVYISSQDVITMLRDDSPQRLDAVLVNCQDADTSGFRFSIDNSDVATISSQSPNGIAYVKPSGSGQAEITITHPKTEIAKKVLVVVGNSAEELAGITYLTTSSNVVAIGEGNTKTVSVSVKNAENPVLDGYTWTSSNPTVVGVNSTGATAVLTGNSIGTAMITVTNRACKYSLQIIAQCVDPIAAAANPYVQLTSSVVTVNTNSGYVNVTADLVGGTQSDFADFIWTSNDSSVCAVFGQNEVGKLRALKTGTTYITVTHPKAVYPAQLLVVCDDIKETECYISVPASIMNMKPTDSTQTITASLVNGSSTDKYSFSWSLDVYDVVDFVYSANVCTITPKQQGQCTITIQHPKAAYPQQIVVTVQEYSDFRFPYTNTTLTQGDVRFFSMEIPNTKVATHVEYSVDNPEICSVSGTKTTAQITAIGSGTTTVRAKLVASSTGVVQAQSEMLVYVKQGEPNAVYISSSTTIYTINKGKSYTLSAVLSGMGITNNDQYNLKWTTTDTDIIQIAGINSDGTIRGNQIYVTALKPGEALITCSHEKAQSDLQFYVVVPGVAEKAIMLNKSYITILKGSSGTQLKATIQNSESNNDYNNLEWSVASVGGEEVCRIMGNGQQITVYPVNIGEAEILVQLPDSPSIAKCTVKVEASKSFRFENTGGTVQPFHTKKYKYIVSPPDAIIDWTAQQADDYFVFRDNGCDEKGVGYVEIEGLKQGNGQLVGLIDGAKASMSIRVSWDYYFRVTPMKYTGAPGEEWEIKYDVNPVEARISIDSAYCPEYFDWADDGLGTITITNIKECKTPIPIQITATNELDYRPERIGTETVNATIKHGTLHPKITFRSSDGNFSEYVDSGNGGLLVLGDGENVLLGVGFEENDADAVVTGMYLKEAPEDIEVEVEETIDGKTQKVKKNIPLVELEENKRAGGWNIRHNKDYQKKLYKITKAFVPVYNGKVVETWETSFKAIGYNYHRFYGSDQDWAGIACTEISTSRNYWVYTQYDDDSDFKFNATYWSRQEDPSYIGKEYTEEEYKKRLWWYYGTPQQNGIFPYKDEEVTIIEYPYVYGGWGKGTLVYRKPGDTGNAQYTLVPVKDTSEVASISSDNILIVEYKRFDENKTYKAEFFVHIAGRNCVKNVTTD